MTDLRPWLEVARPHADISDGSFDESLFAADLGLVARGQGPKDYLDPKDLRGQDLPHRAPASRSGRDRKPPRRRTPRRLRFTGCRPSSGEARPTLCSRPITCSADPHEVVRTPLGQQVVGALKAATLPKATVAVLDGSALGVTPEQMPDGTRVHSLLGHLAWQLGGSSAHAQIRDQDERLLGTSTPEIVRLLENSAPCLILLDETLEYLNKALSVSVGDGNLAGTTLTVIKELCTAAANVPGAAIVATLTSSRLEDYSSLSGEEMFERALQSGGAHREHRHSRRGRRHLPDPAHASVRDSRRTGRAARRGRRLRRLLRTDGRRPATVLPRPRLPEPNRQFLPLPSRTDRHPDQPLGVAVGFPTNPRRAPDAGSHRQGSDTAPTRRNAHLLRRRAPRRRRRAGRDHPLRRGVLQVGAERRHHPRRLHSRRGRPATRRRHCSAPRRGRARHVGVPPQLRLRPGAGSLLGPNAHRRRPAGPLAGQHRRRARRARRVALVHAPRRRPLPVHNRTEPQQGHSRAGGSCQRRPHPATAPRSHCCRGSHAGAVPRHHERRGRRWTSPTNPASLWPFSAQD